MPAGLLILQTPWLLPLSVKCRGRSSDSGWRELPVHWCLDDFTNAASRTTRSALRRWIQPTLRTRPPSVGLVCPCQKGAELRQFRLEECFRFASASTTQLKTFRATYLLPGPRRGIQLTPISMVPRSVRRFRLAVVFRFAGTPTILS